MQQIRIHTTDDLYTAIRAASPGDRLVLMPGEYAGNFVIDKPLEITGDASGKAVTLVAEAGSCLKITSPCTLMWGLYLRATSRLVTLLDIEVDDVAIDECV